MPTVTFKPIIITSGRRKDGTYPVKIRVTFKGASRRIPTSLLCYPSDLTSKRKIKSADVLRKGQALCDEMAATLRDVSPFTLEAWDVDRVVQHIREALNKMAFSLDFFAFGARYVLSKGEVTRRAYTCALQAFSRFLGKDAIDINEITRAMLLDFVDFVEAENKIHYNARTGERKPGKAGKVPQGASSRHLMKLAHIYNAAKARYNDEDAGVIVIPRSPFASIPKPQPPARGQRSVGRDVMQRIISAQTDDPAERAALDAFVVSFGLMGANLADLYGAVPPPGGVWVYHRRKTESRRADAAELRVDVPPQLAPFLERLGAGSSKAWWLPVLRSQGKDKDRCTQQLNRCLRRWAEREGVPAFTYYAARHTFATLARSAAKVEKATVDEALGHVGDYRIADIYAERDWQNINKAAAKVLRLFRW